MFPQISFYGLSLPTFYLVISTSLTALLFWLSKRLDSNLGQNFNRKIAFQLSMIIMTFGFLGARAFHVFYEEWNFYAEYPWQIVKFWNGGFVYFGGFISALTASWFYLKSEKQNFLDWADFLTPLLAASYAFGRLGCFFEGCCYGKFCNLLWATDGRHPTQLYMAFAEFLIVGLLVLIEKKKIPFVGYLFFKWILLHSIFRFIFEYFRGDERGSLIFNLSISQVICVGLAGLSSVYLIKYDLISKRKVFN
jgi:phosphatidylglycerol---prolipoprotein diacylglyceryl transferase